MVNSNLIQYTAFHTGDLCVNKGYLCRPITQNLKQATAYTILFYFVLGENYTGSE